MIWVLEGSLSSWLTYVSGTPALASTSTGPVGEGPWFLSRGASLRSVWTSPWHGFQEQTPQRTRQYFTVPYDLDVTQDHVYLHLPQKRKTCLLKERWTMPSITFKGRGSMEQWLWAEPESGRLGLRPGSSNPLALSSRQTNSCLWPSVPSSVKEQNAGAYFSGPWWRRNKITQEEHLTCCCRLGQMKLLPCCFGCP